MPRLIEVRDALPRSPVGKLTKTELRAEVLRRAGRARGGGAAPVTGAAAGNRARRDARRSSSP